MSLFRYPPGLPSSLSGLDHEHRWALMAALIQAKNEGGSGLAFSELAETVEITSTSKLNYHLQKLIDQGCVEKQDGEYVAHPFVARTLLWQWGHVRRLSDDIGPERIACTCPECGTAVQARFGLSEGEHQAPILHLECPGCEYHWALVEFDIGDVSDWDVPDVVAAVLADTRARERQLFRGFCPDCRGQVTATLTVPDGPTLAEAVTETETPVPVGEATDDDGFPLIEFTCSRCRQSRTRFIGTAALRHPIGEAFLVEGGVDLDTEAFPWRHIDDPAVVESIDPLRVSAGLAVDGTHLSVIVDADAQVVDTTREG